MGISFKIAPIGPSVFSRHRRVLLRRLARVVDVELIFFKLGPAALALVRDTFMVNCLVEAVKLHFQIGLALLRDTFTVICLVEVVKLHFQIGLALLLDTFKVTCSQVVLQIIFTIGLLQVAVLIPNVMEVQYHIKFGLCMERLSLDYVTTVHDGSKTFLGLVWGEVDWEKDQWTASMVLGRGQREVR